MVHRSYESASSVLEMCPTETHENLPKASLGIFIETLFITVKTLTTMQMPLEGELINKMQLYIMSNLHRRNREYVTTYVHVHKSQQDRIVKKARNRLYKCNPPYINFKN